MHARTSLVLVLLSFVVVPSLSQAQQPPQAIVTTGWAGVWEVHEETRECTTQALISTATFLDTLCTGESYYLLPGGFTTQAGTRYATCFGSGFLDTTFELSCSGTSTACLGSSSITTSRAASWTRSGDEATTTVTTTITYGQLCGGGTSCVRTTGTRTRIANEGACGAIPVRLKTWGTLKSIYR